MDKKISFLVTIGLFVFFKQASAQEISVEPSQYSESFQNTLIDHLEKDKLKATQHLDSIKINNKESVDFNEEDILITQRIQKLQKTIPLEYNGRVKAYLDKYISRNYKPYIEKLLGLSQYYFPIYDKIFEEQGLPEEIKYISVVESSLNPHTVSTSGAVGPWQFIYGTAKIYNLSIGNGYDERKDVYSTTYAMSSYIKEAYDEFNDWLLAVASYNCGRGCVRRAIIRSGLNSPSYWELSPFLPKETQNYIPKFIAMAYVLNHTELYDLHAQNNNLMDEHKVIMLDKSLNLDKLASNLGFENEVIRALNPAFKTSYVSASAEKPRRIVIPYHNGMSDSTIYAALNNNRIENEILAEKSNIEEEAVKGYHKAGRGETIYTIAKQYGISVQNLRAWNNLTSKSSILGRNLVLSEPTDAKSSKTLLAERKNSSKNKENSTYLSYTVKKGDTLSDIAGKFKGSSVSKIKADNNIKGSHLKIGRKLKISKGNS